MKQKFISIFILIFLSACSSIAPAPATTALAVSTNTHLPTKPPTSVPTQTAIPTENPTASYQKIEAEYLETLSPEQKSLYEQYGSKDRTAEGLVRRFLDGDLSSYLAYVDMMKDSKDLNEVVAVWNQEQQKPNPALLIENNLFINESSSSEIIWNPDMDRTKAKQTMADYMKYVRLKLVAEANGIELSNTLEGALANMDAQKLLTNGSNVILNRTSLSRTDHNFNIPDQTFFISNRSGLVIKFTNKVKDNMFLRGRVEGLLGIGFEQNTNMAIQVEYMDTGVSYLNQFKDLKKYIFSARIGEIFSHAIARVKSPSADFIVDTVTETNIINNKDVDSFKPIIVFSTVR